MASLPRQLRVIALTVAILAYVCSDSLPAILSSNISLTRFARGIAASFSLPQDRTDFSTRETEEARQQTLKDAEAKGYTSGQKDGYEKGQKEGYEKGSKDGEAKGYDSGYNAGVQAKAAKEKADSWETKVREVLTWIFGSFFYPIVVIGIFIYIVAMIAVIIVAGDNGAARIRRSVGAVLPILMLVFLVVTGQHKDNPIGIMFGNMSPLLRFIAGAGTGFILMELGKWLLDIDSEISSSLYALFLSSLGAFLIWSVIGDVLPVVNLSLFGLVLAGCMHVIFRGPPEI